MIAASSDMGPSSDRLALSEYARLIQERLLEFCAMLSQSEFVEQHEFIGSSILIVADATGKVGAFWIDFAKTFPVPVKITHRDPWELGNHEDGIFLGLDHFLQCWDEVLESLRAREKMEGQESSGPSSLGENGISHGDNGATHSQRHMGAEFSERASVNFYPSDGESDIALLSSVPCLKGKISTAKCGQAIFAAAYASSEEDESVIYIPPPQLGKSLQPERQSPVPRILLDPFLAMPVSQPGSVAIPLRSDSARVACVSSRQSPLRSVPTRSLPSTPRTTPQTTFRRLGFELPRRAAPTTPQMTPRRLRLDLEIPRRSASVQRLQVTPRRLGVEVPWRHGMALTPRPSMRREPTNVSRGYLYPAH